MAFSINEFTAAVNAAGGLAKNNLFYVRVTPPAIVKGRAGSNLPRTLSMFCKTASVPGMTLGTAPIQTQGFGKSEYRPTEFTMEDLRLVFMVDGKFEILEFFQEWMQSIFNYSSYYGYTHEDRNGKVPGEFEYKDNYVGTIEVVSFSGHHSAPEFEHVYTFGNAFPTSVEGIESAWENQAEVMVLPVAFTFDKMKFEGTKFSATNRTTASEAGSQFLSAERAQGPIVVDNLFGDARRAIAGLF